MIGGVYKCILSHAFMVFYVLNFRLYINIIWMFMG